MMTSSAAAIYSRHVHVPPRCMETSVTSSSVSTATLLKPLTSRQGATHGDAGAPNDCANSLCWPKRRERFCHTPVTSTVDAFFILFLQPSSSGRSRILARIPRSAFRRFRGHPNDSHSISSMKSDEICPREIDRSPCTPPQRAGSSPHS